jgi:hypothetical protein
MKGSRVGPATTQVYNASTGIPLIHLSLPTFDQGVPMIGRLPVIGNFHPNIDQ